MCYIHYMMKPPRWSYSQWLLWPVSAPSICWLWAWNFLGALEDSSSLGCPRLLHHVPSFAHPSAYAEVSPNIWSTSSVQSLSPVRLFATPWIPARQASLSITNSRSSLKLMSIELVMPSSHSSSVVPSPPAPNPSQHESLFQWVSSLHEAAKGSTSSTCFFPFLVITMVSYIKKSPHLFCYCHGNLEGGKVHILLS